MSLDAVQARLDKAREVRHGWVLLPIEDAEELVAELRVARRTQDQLHTRTRDRSPLGVALAEWDQFTRPDPETTP